MKIIFVCTGNTCRSPMAEAIARQYIKENELTDVTVASYGLNVNPFENQTEKKALDALKTVGITARKKKSKQINAKILNSANYIVTMTAAQKGMLPYSNVYTVDELSGAGDIPDPYGGSEDIYDITAFKLKIAVSTIMSKICKEK